MIACGGFVCDADRAVQHWLQGATLQQDEALQGLAGSLNWWGGPGVIWFGALLWLAARAFGRRRLSLAGLRGVEALAIASAISGLIKGFAGRERPFVEPGEPWHFNLLHGWIDARYFSLPSGHTTATFAFAVATLVVTRDWPWPSRTGYRAALLLSAVAVAFARMYTDQHWLSDVVVGALLGGATGWIVADWHARRGDTAFDRVLAGKELPS
ncbi:MAG: phosphatase PAP2 family protein [Gemmatimonadetes bacterium]|nr:phosphatase PAP2 family protein [Gemmatimonadota bacterium]MBI3504500.1 phosphatase PAP2 family protein [Pseudomonadota bacterium]